MVHCLSFLAGSKVISDDILIIVYTCCVVLEVGDGVFEVLSTSGDTHLGGDDFDKVRIGS